jgi:cold-inducible RNA-binding protein
MRIGSIIPQLRLRARRARMAAWYPYGVLVRSLFQGQPANPERSSEKARGRCGGPSRSNIAESSVFDTKGFSMKLYVGNLSYSAGENDLRELFSQYGTVESVAVITDRDTGRSKGFGFVEFANDAEAQAAIAGLNGKDMSGRSLTVSQARPRAEGGGGGGGRGGYGGGGGGGRRNRY